VERAIRQRLDLNAETFSPDHITQYSDTVADRQFCGRKALRHKFVRVDRAHHSNRLVVLAITKGVHPTSLHRTPLTPGRKAR
jgi:hypothetical protein